VARARLVATALALAALAAGCAGGESSGVEGEIAARYEAFPSDAQARGTPPWPEGRLAGDCGREAGDVYLCFYEDARGRQGYACFAAEGGALKVLSAAGAHDPGRRFDHDGRALPPDGRCGDYY
jgi:hypothetical protein